VEISEMTGAGETIDIGGRRLKLRVLNGWDIGKMDAFFRERQSRPMARYVKQMQELLPLKEFDPDAYEKARKDLLLAAYEDEKGAPSMEQSLSAMEGLESVAFTLHLMVQHEHPDVTYEWVAQAIKNEDLAEIKKKIDRVQLAWSAILTKDQPGDENGRPLPAPTPG
jgi:hypothetical protein